jgi:tRNA(Ile)-lysidine synthase
MLENGWRITADWVDIDFAEISHNSNPWHAYIDNEDNSPLYVRGRLSGEKIQPLGLGGSTSTIQDIMVDNKIPSKLRLSWPLVATREHVVWLVGKKVDDRLRVYVRSEKIIRLRCFREEAIS